MQILSLVGFKSLTVYCLSSWFDHQELKTYSASFVLCGLGHLAWFQGLKYIPPSFWPQVTNHDNKSKKSWKSNFLCHCFFTQLVHDAERLKRKPKTFVKVIQRFWYVKHIRLIFKKKIYQRQPKFQPWQNSSMLKKPRISSLNHFVQKLPKITLHGNWNCSTPKQVNRSLRCHMTDKRQTNPS